MSFTAGVFSINTTGQPVVTGTVISSTVFNALTADLATGLSTCILKDGSQTVTANIPMSSFKFSGLAAGTTAGDSTRYEQVLLLTGGTMAGNLIVPDSNLQVVGSGDPTKKMVFEVDGITTATTRTVTMPDADVNLGTLSLTTTPGLIQNAGLAVTMGSNAVTIALKGIDGNDPSASNIVAIGFRNATLTSGQASKVNVVAALSTVISSGSKGGTVDAQASRIWIAGILVAGAVELAWYQSVLDTAGSTTSIKGVNEGGVISTTAEGGAGAADSAQTWYSTTARTNVPFTILGYFDSTQTTAGTWAASATTVVVNPKIRPGQTIQTVSIFDGAVQTGSTTLPDDDTIPQSGEGNLFYTTPNLTPYAAAHVLRVKSILTFATGTSAGTMGMALFQDAGANAIAATRVYESGSNTVMQGSLFFEKVLNATAATSLKIRAGQGGAGTLTLNGSSAARKYGGAMVSGIWLEEVVV